MTKFKKIKYGMFEFDNLTDFMAFFKHYGHKPIINNDSPLRRKLSNKLRELEYDYEQNFKNNDDLSKRNHLAQAVMTIDGHGVASIKQVRLSIKRLTRQMELCSDKDKLGEYSKYDQLNSALTHLKNIDKCYVENFERLF